MYVLSTSRAGNGFTRELPIMHCFQHNKLQLVLLLLDAGATVDGIMMSTMVEKAKSCPEDEFLHLVVVAAACAMKCVSFLSLHLIH